MNTYGIIRTFGIVVLLAAASAQCSKIDEQMTNDEIANLFHTTRYEIPEYDVVPVRHNRYKRSDQNLRMQFTAFGKEIDAYLHPTDGQLMGANTPVWLAFTKPNGTIEYKKMRKGIVGIVVSSFFTSPTDFSTVAVTQTKGENPSFNGVVAGLLIRPLPKSYQEEARSRQNRAAPNASRTMLDTDYHVIIKSTSVIEEEKIRGLERQIREASRSGKRPDGSRVKRSDREIIYPSVLVQTDYNSSKTTQNDLDYYEEILYQLAYWNAVDLRFRHVNDPKIRIRIAGIIIGQDRNATPYLQNHRSGDVIDMDRGFKKMQQYWYNMTLREEFPPEAYDVVVTLTDTDMMFRGHLARGMAAHSFCSEPWDNQYYAVAIARDNGGFDGILTTTHELGHILGLDHDPTTGEECNKSKGFIMAAKRVPLPKNMEWSPCSLENLSYFLRDPDFTCYDEPADFHPPGDPVQRLLPGDVWGPHKQCQARGYDWACEPSPDMCKVMKCFHTDWQPYFSPGWRCENAGPAAEGTLCAPGHKCVDAVCQCMTTDCIYTN